MYPFFFFSLRHKNYKTDAGIFEFSLDADLTSLWNWNTKVVFFYLVAEYETEKSVSSLYHCFHLIGIF